LRTDGRPSVVAVANAIAVGSTSSARTWSNQRANWRNGSASDSVSLSGSP
jgi:hypothetical protein